jgi:hypothetical protein
MCGIAGVFHYKNQKQRTLGEAGSERPLAARVHLVRYAECVAPHSQLCGAIMPMPRQQGVDENDSHTETPHWSWARLMGHVFDLAMAPCLFCRSGSLRIIAAMTHESVIRPILRPLNLASVPPPIAPVRSRQETFDWVA